MTAKDKILNELAQYRPIDKELNHYIALMEFAMAHDNPFDRSIKEGHVTASALVLSPDARRLLLIYHNKLDRWLQPGGHGEPGERDGQTIARREAREETGLVDLIPLGGLIGVDVHTIPAGKDPEHLHYDLRYALCAPDTRTTRNVAEVSDCHWVEFSELDRYDLDPSLHRAARRARKAHVNAIARGAFRR